MTLMTSLFGWMLSLAFAFTQTATATPQRFDYLVRADFFAGVAGDDARLQKAMDLCEKTLAENPTHADALVWHGAALLVKSGRAFGKGDLRVGGELWERGLKEMDGAVALVPDSPAILIPRSATLFEATRNLPIEAARPLIETAVKGYEHVLEIQAPYFASLGDHPKGELLFGLAEGYHRLGDHARARMYFERLIKEAPESGQTAKAREWLATGTIPKSAGPSCTGCHK